MPARGWTRRLLGLFVNFINVNERRWQWRSSLHAMVARGWRLLGLFINVVNIDGRRWHPRSLLGAMVARGRRLLSLVVIFV